MKMAETFSESDAEKPIKVMNIVVIFELTSHPFYLLTTPLNSVLCI